MASLRMVGRAASSACGRHEAVALLAQGIFIHYWMPKSLISSANLLQASTARRQNWNFYFLYRG